MKIKICGCRRLEDIEIMNHYQPDYVGFVFAESQRKISPYLAEKLKIALHPQIETVGVFVNESIENIVKLCKEKIIDIVQLHGDEKDDYVNRLREQITCRIIKAYRFADEKTTNISQNDSCDYYLFDTYHSKQYGGSGQMFNHSLIPEVQKPYFLAGGMTLKTISQVVSKCFPYGIDISSGVEVDGYKNQKLVEEVIKLVHTFSSKNEKAEV